MPVKWTPEARKAAQRACTDDNAEQIVAAIAYAEQLAEYEGSAVVDSDLWRQSWGAVSRARRLARRPPYYPAQHPDIPDAS